MAMVVGLGTITFRLSDCRSLKEKRKIIKSIISRSRNGFNITFAEIDQNDAHQSAKLGFAMVGNDHRRVNSLMDKLLEFIDSMSLAEIIDTDTEIISI